MRRRRDEVLPSACDQHGSGFMRVCLLPWLRRGRTRLGRRSPLICVNVDKPARRCGARAGRRERRAGAAAPPGARGRDAGLLRVNPLRRCRIPRCCFQMIPRSSISSKLVGFAPGGASPENAGTRALFPLQVLI